MTGHVRRRGKSWAAIVDVPREPGQRRRQKWYSGFPSKRAADVFLIEQLGAIAKGAYVQPSRSTLAAALEEYLTVVKATLRPSTFAGYSVNVNAYIVPALGDVPLQRLTAAMLTSFYSRLLENGRRERPGPLSPRTVRYVHAVLKLGLAWAVTTGKLGRNPADDAKLPRQQRRPETRTWTAAELRRFLDHVAGDRYHAAFVLAATTGMRRGEVLGLRWADVDLDGGRVSVTQSLLSISDRLTFGEPKTGSSRRSITLDAHTAAALQAHRQRALAERLSFGAEWPDHDLVFTRPDGSPVHPHRFSADHFQRHVKAAGLPRIRFHDLRHGHATLALQAGIPAKVVSERLGHSSIVITMDRYSHVLPAMEEEAAEKIAAVVFG